VAWPGAIVAHGLRLEPSRVGNFDYTRQLATMADTANPANGRAPWLAAIGVAALFAAAFVVRAVYEPAPVPAPAGSVSAGRTDAGNAASSVLTGLRALVDAHRKIIVVLSGDAARPPDQREAGEHVARAIYYDSGDRSAKLDQTLASIARSTAPARFAEIEAALGFVEAEPDLFDADRLAFRETLRTLQHVVAADQSLTAVHLHKRVSDDLAALDQIEALYDKELKPIFGRFEERAIVLKREKWSDYIAKLSRLFDREKIMKDWGTIVPLAHKAEVKDESVVITGRSLPPKTLMLTFDDGPHPTYTEEIAAILKQYGVPAVFFEVGQNLGSVGSDGGAKLGRLAAKSSGLVDAGFVLGNHSFRHLDFAKQDEETLMREARNTGILIDAVGGSRSNLFRFPYGAHGAASFSALHALKLRAMAWNIDSRDWADPVPNSIAQRVLDTIATEQRGVMLFHDIKERTVKVLPLILDRLVSEGYCFATWDGSEFKVQKQTAEPAVKAVPTTGYRESYALVVGINRYTMWPKLEYAIRDAAAVRKVLVDKLGFQADHVLSLENEQATRVGILDALHQRLGNVEKDDRVFVFFAGHGATRKLSTGRDIGYIVPVDSAPDNVATDAISMTELQTSAEALRAKHVLFVMDSCYSGLGLTRGGGSPAFLRENARRVARQMLTAGGSDQAVADGGPGGHSIFTWTLLLGLDGKADLNGDGYITGSELAAYMAPAVSSVSRQTPAFGSLPGSEGGEFVFELPTDAELLSQDTRQLEPNALDLSRKIAASQPFASDSGQQKVTVKNLDGDEAQIALGPAAAIAPRISAVRHNGRGLALYREERYGEAEAEFTEALKLQPDFAHAANNLGFVYYKQGKNEEAARWFENTIRLDPSRAVAYYNLGDAYVALGDKPKAKKAYATFLELSPKAAAAGRVREVLSQL
jgi:uncharacterized caspase-like protein/peptidoglycan/xylan/chitin deacetylase (PgdA/CDA1 family)